MAKGCTPNKMQRRPGGTGSSKVKNPLPKPKKTVYRPQGR